MLCKDLAVACMSSIFVTTKLVFISYITLLYHRSTLWIIVYPFAYVGVFPAKPTMNTTLHIKLTKAKWCIYASVSDVFHPWFLLGTKPLSEPMMVYCLLVSNGPSGINFNGIWIKIQQFSFKKMDLKMSYITLQSFCFSFKYVTDASAIFITISIYFSQWPRSECV